MDQEAMKEPAASTPVWDELEEWTRGRIQDQPRMPNCAR